jgi:hypothetical protein
MSQEAITVLAVIVVLVVGATLVAQRRGYKVDANAVVRCRKGHLFTTIWVPGVSLKAVRLGWVRLQHCPVGNHWTVVTPIKDADLTDEERGSAAEHHDVRIP